MFIFYDKLVLNWTCSDLRLKYKRKMENNENIPNVSSVFR